ncbi:putative amino acid/polyamine transporter I [Rosa chinensis]|uniref:Putative amino acid/polyamine transporter I n=1 Tax=Rosa chinensis TaxID=74649 RepID=A0A2P6RST6_ROSCH|nr:amino-acid permease BAT1 homolog [Rosa chinensis]PRQ49498.1 putative amino acid/polyamine transporter I [Rosa chinensis]
MGQNQVDASQIREMDSGEKRLNELGYKQELRREMTLFKTLAISFSTMTLFTGITPLYGSSLVYAGPASLVWGWVVVSFFTWFVGLAMAEICSSFPTTGSLYFWAAHLAGPKWGPLASWCCAWLETIGLIAGIGTQAYAGSQTLQSIILLCTGTNKGGGYFAPKWLFLCMYIGLTLIWAFLNTFALEVIAFIDIISIWWQVVGGTVIVIMLPLVALTTQSASYVFTNFDVAPEVTGISSKPYAVILSFLVSQYSLYGYDAAAHLTEETRGADKNGPIAILTSIGIISVFGWAYILALTFSIQDFSYLYDPTNETRGAFVPAQILYDAFHGRYHSSTGAIILLFIIWGSFFFGGLSITTSAARVVYALSRDQGIPFSSVWRKIHPKHKVPSNAVWLCAAICILLGLPILKVNVVFTAITSICTIGWVGGYAVPIFARMVMPEKKFNPGPFYLGNLSRPICLVAFLWICYTCSVFLLPTYYPISWSTFNYAPVALSVGLGLIMLWWVLDARKWFKGPVRNIETEHNGKV